ncbi:MAG: SDR family NAD(P)-dependent oxidoreductase [Microbacterium sp.]|nr:SDR family NAD(P)-dependent oxidoreductase [Microbacterium sp.]
MFRLDDKIAVVTGGGSGIGLATVRRLAHAGSSVTVIDRDPTAAEAAARDIGGRFAVADVSDEAEMKDAVRDAAGAARRIGILINNAGDRDRRNVAHLLLHRASRHGLPHLGHGTARSLGRVGVRGRLRPDGRRLGQHPRSGDRHPRRRCRALGHQGNR